MLISRSNRHGDSPSDLDSIHNYYEQLVLEELQTAYAESFDDSNFIADVACVALNHLPPRYIRYHVDMAFYLSPKERAEMLDKVREAVKSAVEFVHQRSRERPAV